LVAAGSLVLSCFS